MRKNKPALEFKGRMLSLTRVRVLDIDPAAVEAQIRSFARSVGEAVRGMPVLLEAEEPLNLTGVVAAMRAVGMQPIAALDGPAAGPARACGLPVLPADVLSEGSARAITVETPEPEPAAAPAPPATRKSTRVIIEPVRSGQQIYAEGGDLVITNTVSPGAEVIADGCVHVYGTLRGRAIAGARGDIQSRLFCRKMEAELLAVAGIYAVAEQIHGTLRGQSVQAYLSEGKLRIERLEL